MEIGQEVRFAVVMYGGVSLAVYINGVVQELLHLVRATAPDPSQRWAQNPHTDITELVISGTGTSVGCGTGTSVGVGSFGSRFSGSAGRSGSGKGSGSGSLPWSAGVS